MIATIKKLKDGLNEEVTESNKWNKFAFCVWKPFLQKRTTKKKENKTEKGRWIIEIAWNKVAFVWNDYESLNAWNEVGLVCLKWNDCLPTTADSTVSTENGSQTALVPPPPPTVPLPIQPAPVADFTCPARPNHGTEGRTILLRANHFQVRIPKGYIHHYDVSITPDKCPRRVNRSVGFKREKILRSSVGGVAYVIVFNSSATWAATFHLRGWVGIDFDHLWSCQMMMVMIVMVEGFRREVNIPAGSCNFNDV